MLTLAVHRVDLRTRPTGLLNGKIIAETEEGAREVFLELSTSAIRWSRYNFVFDANCETEAKLDIDSTTPHTLLKRLQEGLGHLYEPEAGTFYLEWYPDCIPTKNGIGSLTGKWDRCALRIRKKVPQHLQHPRTHP